MEAIAREGIEDALVVGFVVQPELAAVPRRRDGPPPFARGGEQQLPEPWTAADQAGELIVVIRHVHQSSQPPRREAETIIPESGVRAGDALALRERRKRTPSGEYHRGVTRLQLRDRRNGADHRTNKTYEGHGGVRPEQIFVALLRIRGHAGLEERDHHF